MNVFVDAQLTCVWIQWEGRSIWECPEGEMCTCSHCPPSALYEDVSMTEYAIFQARGACCTVMTNHQTALY